MKPVSLIVVFLLSSGIVRAVPAYRGPILRTAEDGSEHVVYLHGNEHFHYMTDSAGQWLDERTLLPMSASDKAARIGSPAPHRSPQQLQAVGKEPNIPPRGLVILVNYQDVVFETPKDTVDSMLNGANFHRDYNFRYHLSDGVMRHKRVVSSGSARQYFQSQSYGKYNPFFDVIGPVQVSKKCDYYGENDKSGNDKRAAEMIKEACVLADQAGVDFTQYDNDNDGTVDFVFVIYAGFGEADGGSENTIWPHQHDMQYTSQRCSPDGKNIGRYACSCELNYISKHYTGIGTFVHEYSHVMGLPDLYETSDEPQDIHTLGWWDIMDYGPYCNDGNTPPAYSAYERFYMNWLTPRLLKEPEYVRLRPIHTDASEAILLTTHDTHNMVGWHPDPKTFYLLEVRQQKGWDRYIPGPGLLVTKVQYDEDKWIHNQVNNDPVMQGVDIIEAQENTEPGSLPTDAFPAGAEEWLDLRGHEVTNIVLNEDGSVEFSFHGEEKPVDEAIEEVNSQPSDVRKVRKSGQIVIIRENKEYNILGKLL